LVIDRADRVILRAVADLAANFPEWLREALTAPEAEPAQPTPDQRNRPVGEVESCLRCGNCAHWQPPSGRVSGYPFCRNAQSSRCNLVTQRDESCELYALGTGAASGKGAE